MERTYKAHQASADESNEGWILIRPSPEDKELCDTCQPGRRPIVRIKGTKFKPVYAEALLADRTYLKHRKEVETDSDTPLIFISAWYRNLFAMNKLESITLDIEPVSSLNLVTLLYRYPRDHPQALVRAANMMAIIGFGLGVIGFGLGLVGINDWIKTDTPIPHLTNFSTPFGLVLLVVWLAIAILGIIGLIRRRQE